MTAAGDLDRRVQFRRSSLVDDGMSKVPVFADHGTPVWASKRDLSDGERWRAAEVQANVTTRFVVRWSGFAAGLTPKDRLVCEGREYEITGIKEVGRREWVEITTAARIDKVGG
jgi:SPP1 family predicted phage head-tail adaptor